MASRAEEIDKRLSYRLSTAGTVAMLDLTGELDAYTLPKAHRLVDAVVDEGTVRVVLDASGIRYVDSAGLGFFVATHKKLEDREGGLKVASPSGPLKRLFRLIHLDTLFDVYDRPAQALDAFGTELDGQIDRWKEFLGDQEFPDLRVKLGEAYQARGMLAEAEYHYRRALEKNDRYLAPCLGLSEVLRWKGRREEAALYLRRALEIAPDHPRATARLGLLTGNAELLQKAVKLYRRELKANPNYADIHNGLGEVLFGLERNGEARDAFREALRLNGSYALARINLGRVLLREGHKAPARAELAKLGRVRLTPVLREQLEELEAALG